MVTPWNGYTRHACKPARKGERGPRDTDHSTTPETMTDSKERIQTHNLATERVTRDGDTFKLGSHSPLETSGSLPALVYDAEEQTIWSKGGRKYNVDLTTHEDLPFDMPSQIRIVDSHGMDAEWSFGGHTPDASQRERLQLKRAKALIDYAIS